MAIIRKIIKNLTPHEVRVLNDNNEVVVAMISEGIARVSSESKVVDTLNGVPITETVFGEVTGLPPETEGTYYVVSRMVASAASERHDLLVPGLQVRDEQGRVVGCKSLDRP